MAKINVTVTVDNSALVKGRLNSAFARALERIGLQAEGYAKRLCPVDTGNLRNSITHISDGKAAYIGTNVEYAPYVELGTRRIAAQPYLRPAAADHTGTYVNIVKDELRNG